MMNKNPALVQRDLQSIWHPCAQMKDYESFTPIIIQAAKGSYFICQNGEKVLDAISSWWCKNLGHGQPRLQKALRQQLKKFEHVILANTTNEVIVELSERLTRLTTTLAKIFYASEGACAVEIALKMAMQARVINHQPQKNQFAALQHGYHGETLMALAVSDVGIYRRAYEPYLQKVTFIENLPYLCSSAEALWVDSSISWQAIECQLEQVKDNLSAIIIEPIVQGAGGMRIYSRDFLVRLRQWCHRHDVYLIADEIMTGFGRTGQMFAYQYADIEPDFLCIGKGMTAGFLPMSAVLTTNHIYQLFYDNYESGKAFLHSHTYSGHSLAAAVAIEMLNIIESEAILSQVQALEFKLTQAMHEVADSTQCLINVRGIGAVVAADLKTTDSQKRWGYEIFRCALAAGVYLRPLGNTLYWLPPFTIKNKELQQLRDVTIKAIRQVIR